MATLDFIGALLGIIYILLEYRASIWLWAVSIIMPLVDMMLYFRAGLYADFGMAIYYALAAIYGYIVWKWGTANIAKPRKELPITHFPHRLILPSTLCFLLIWLAIYQLLIHFTDSSVPLQDSFTSALSIIALWALAHKYAEQWLLWIVVDAVSAALYTYKGIPFKASLYALYVVIAIFGYRRWVREIHKNTCRSRA